MSDILSIEAGKNYLHQSLTALKQVKIAQIKSIGDDVGRSVCCVSAATNAKCHSAKHHSAGHHAFLQQHCWARTLHLLLLTFILHFGDGMHITAAHAVNTTAVPMHARISRSSIFEHHCCSGDVQ